MLTIINPIHANSRNQGNLLKDIDKKTVRKENIEPIKRVYTYSFFSNTLFKGQLISKKRTKSSQPEV